MNLNNFKITSSSIYLNRDTSNRHFIVKAKDETNREYLLIDHVILHYQRGK